MSREQKGGQEDAAIRMATVYLYPASGRSLLADAPSAAGIKAYHPPPDAMRIVKQALVDRGFAIEAEGVTLSISGPAALFAKYCTQKEQAGRQLFEIKELNQYVEAIEFSVPGRLF